MLFNRRFFIAFLALALLIRSAAGFAMQIEMTYTLTQASVAMKAPAHEAHPCHTDNPVSNADSAQSPHHSDCGQCCVPALLPSIAVFKAFYSPHPAPFAALFNNVPAPAQRPVKPPLV